MICAAVAFLILGPRPEGMAGLLDVSGLPVVNASLNGITTLLLVTGLVLVKQRRFDAHKTVMLASFGSSTAFLVSYVIYHWFKAGPKLYEGDFRTVYLVNPDKKIRLANRGAPPVEAIIRSIQALKATKAGM